ncbi:MAG: hypothetical protein Q9186_005103 [Xanthomendoza sp. 1 TL-2023]
MSRPLGFRPSPPGPEESRAEAAHRGSTNSAMSFYEAQSWQLPMRQGSWDQPPPPPSRSGTLLSWLHKSAGADGEAQGQIRQYQEMKTRLSICK